MIQISDVLDHIIIKEKNYADNIDRQWKSKGIDTRKLFLEYKYATTETDSIYTYTYTLEDLKDYTDSKYKLSMMLRKDGAGAITQFLTKEQQQHLLNKKRIQVREDYFEYNEYYRVLLGLPPIKRVFNTVKSLYEYIEDEAYFFYIKEKLLGVDNTKPVHKWTADERTSLKGYKFSKEDLLKYPYLKHIHRNTNIISLRDADFFDIIWSDINISSSSTNVLLPFLDEYRIMKNYYMKNHYSHYDSIQNSMYEKIQLIMIFMATLHNINAKEMSNIGMRELELEDIYNIFSSFGLPKYKFSLKYLKIIASRLSMLVYNKGTNSNLNDLSDLFHDIKIFKYFLVKSVNEDNINSESNYDKYDLNFVKTPLLVDDPYDYLDDKDNVFDFHNIVDSDARWGFEQHIHYPQPYINREGELVTTKPVVDPKLEHQLKDTEFSWTESKYLGLDAVVNLGWMSLKVASFYRWILDNKKLTERYKLRYDYIDVDTNIFELMIYLQCLMFYKYKREPSIPDTQEGYFKIFTIAESVNVNDVIGVIERIYPGLLTQKFYDGTNEVNKFNNKERLSTNNNKLAMGDMSYILDRYSERKELRSEGILEDKLSLDDNLDIDISTYYNTNKNSSLEEIELVKNDIIERRRGKVGSGIETYKTKDNGELVKRLIKFLRGENERSQVHNTYSKFEINNDIIGVLYDIRNKVEDYKDFEMIDTVIRVLTEGEKQVKQFTKPDGTHHKTLLEYLVSLDPHKNIAFSLRIDRLASDEDNYKDNFDNEIIEVLSVLRSSEIFNEDMHEHTYDALEYTQRVYTDNEVLRYLEIMVDFFKSYTQDIITKGSEYILDNGRNVIRIIDTLISDVELKDFDVATAYIAFSTLPNETLTQIVDILSPSETTFTSERLDIYIDDLGKYHELKSDGLYLT